MHENKLYWPFRFSQSWRRHLILIFRQAERDHLVQVMRNQMVDKDERKVSENMAARPAMNSDALWDVIESKSKEEILVLSS